MVIIIIEKYNVYRISILNIVSKSKHENTDFFMVVILTVSLGTSKILASSVTVPTITAMQFSRPGFFMNLVTRAREIGGRWILLINSLLRMILLNLELVLLAKNLYNYVTILTC